MLYSQIISYADHNIPVIPWLVENNKVNKLIGINLDALASARNLWKTDDTARLKTEYHLFK